MKKQLLLILSIALFTQSFVFAQDYALEFDGANSRVKYPTDATLDIMNGTTDYTIEVWVKPTSTEIHNRVIVKRWYQYAITLYNNDTKRFYFTHYTNTGTTTFVNTIDNVINIDEWNHLVVICNSSENTIKLYANGVDVTLGTQEALPLEAAPGDSANFYVGYGGSGTIPFADIDKVRVKKTAESIDNLQTSVTDTDYTTDADTSALFNMNEGVDLLTLNEASGTNANLECYDCTEYPTWILLSSTLSNKDNNTTEFSIFPNPVNTEFFTVQARNNETILEVELVDILGKSVKRIGFDTPINSENINIDKLNVGIYFLKIKTDAGIGTQKIVIE